MKVLMATKNPIKIEGAKRAFETYFDDVEIVAVSVDSNVSAQPFNEDVYKGARNRVDNLKKYATENNIEADFFIASEAGIMNFFKEWININLVIIESKDGLESVGTSQGFPIPEKYIEEIKEKELRYVMERIFRNECDVQKCSGISFLTKGELNRTELTKNAFLMALTKHINGEIWR